MITGGIAGVVGSVWLVICQYLNRDYCLLIPGRAIRILDRTTCEMATLAIFFECPIFSPFSSKTAIPLVSSLKVSGLVVVGGQWVSRTSIASSECWHSWRRPLTGNDQIIAQWLGGFGGDKPAAIGTKRPISGGNRFTMLLSVNAVANAPEVAKQYDLTSCLRDDHSG